MDNIKIAFNQKAKQYFSSGGVYSTITWDQLMPFLRMAFNCEDKETIACITVNEEGIKAKFEQQETSISRS